MELTVQFIMILFLISALILTTECKIFKKFYFIETKASHYQAKIICNHNGLALATIESEDEQNYLEHHMENAQIDSDIAETSWINGKRINDDSPIFHWDTWPPKEMNYTKWHPNEPNNNSGYLNSDEYCLAITKKGGLYGWNDVPCDSSYKYHFICMKQEDDTLTTETSSGVYWETTERYFAHSYYDDFD